MSPASGDGDVVHAHFTRCALDCTPEKMRSAACVLFAPLSRDADVSRRCASVLSGAERRQAERFLTGENRGRFEQRRAFRLYCGGVALGRSGLLSGLDFEATDKGRPRLARLPGCSFSFSACQLGLLGAWSATHDVGVDIEAPNREGEHLELSRHYFAPAETAAMASLTDAGRTEAFFRLWTSKEAALKSIGEGLPFGLDAFVLELEPFLRMTRVPAAFGGPDRFQVCAVDGTGGCASLVVRTRGMP